MLFFMSCNISNESKEEVITVIPVIKVTENLNTNKVDEFLLSDIASDLNFVQLEVTDKSMIREIMDIEVSDEYILVKDISEGVFLFSRDGKFLNSIGKKGNGPQEYLAIVQSILDDKNREVVLYTTRGIKIYGLDGLYKRAIPNTFVEDLFKGNDHRIFLWNNCWFLNEKLPVLYLNKDLYSNNNLWTFALVDSFFSIDKKYYNPSFKGKEDDIVENKASFTGWKNYYTEDFASIDFYNNTFQMCYYGGDTIYRFDIIKKEFFPTYVLSLGEQPAFEVSHSWIKDPAFFDFLWLSNFFETKDFLYLLLAKSDYVYNFRYNKKSEEIKISKFKTKINERYLPGSSGLVHRRRATIAYSFKNDISGGSPFVIDHKSKDGMFLIDVMTFSDFWDNINVNDLKSESVLNENSKVKLIELLNNLSEEDNPVLLIATLK